MIYSNNEQLLNQGADAGKKNHRPLSKSIVRNNGNNFSTNGNRNPNKELDLIGMYRNSKQRCGAINMNVHDNTGLKT
jgi:hypothetical protein